MRYTLLAYAIGLGMAAGSWALPTDPSPAHGQVQIQTISPNFLQILQSSPQAILNWNQFNIGLGETVRFLQPSTQAAILNRVTGIDPSLIQGTLQANGRVFLLNPNGILFGPGSVVDVGSFTASTLKMSDEDFLSGNFKFTQDRSLPLAAITNQGEIRVADGGFVVLVSPLLDNQGLIVAQTGQVNLGATTQATFSLDGRGQVQFAMPDGFNPQFSGGGQGGTVLLQPGQMSQVLSQVVTNPGLVEAGSFESAGNGRTLAHGAEGVLLNSGIIRAEGGAVRLDSSQSTVHTGTVSANGGDARVLSDGTTLSLGAISANNGFVEVSGQHLHLYGPVSAANGTILLDPDNITIIDGNNGNGTFDPGTSLPPNGDGTVSTGAIQAASNLVLSALNDISYAGGGFSAPATSLTLIAGNDINLTNNGTLELGELILRAGQDINVSHPGTLRMFARTGDLDFQTTNGDILVSGGFNGNIELAANGDIHFAAGRDLTLHTDSPFSINETANQANFSAVRDVLLETFNWGQPSVMHTVHVDAGRDVLLNGPGGSSTQMSVGGFNVTADRNITSTHGSFNLGSYGELKLQAGGNLTFSDGSLSLTSQTSRVALSGSEVSSNTAFNTFVQGHTDVNVTSTAGNISFTAGTDNRFRSPNGGLTMRSTGGNITTVAGTNLEVGSSGATLVDSAGNLSMQSGGANSIQLDGTTADLRAANDLSLNTLGIFQSNAGPLGLQAGQDVLISSPSGLHIGSTIPSITVEAARDLLVNVPGQFSITTLGDQTLSAGRTLRTDIGGSNTYQANGGKIVWTGGAVNSTSGGGQNFLSSGGVNITSTDGAEDLIMRVSSGDIILQADDAAALVNVTSGRDLLLTAGSNVYLRSGSAGAVGLRANRDVVLDPGNPFTLSFRGPTASVVAGNDLSLLSLNLLRDNPGPTALTLVAGNDLRMQSDPLNGLRFEYDSVDASAGRDLTALADGNLALTALTGDLRLHAGRNVTLTGGSHTISSAGQTRIDGQNVSVLGGSIQLDGTTGANLTASAGNVNLQSNGAITLRSTGGDVLVNATGDISMPANSQITLSSQSSSHTNVTAGRDLTMVTPDINSINLAGGPSYLTGGRNVSLTTPSIQQGDVSIQSGTGNISMQGYPLGSLSIQTTALNVSSGNDLLATTPGQISWTTSGGDLRLNALGGINLTTGSDLNLNSAANLRVQGANVTTRASGNSLLNGATGTVVNATNGDVDLRSDLNLLEIRSGGLYIIRATRDILLNQANNLNLNAPNGMTVDAGRDFVASTTADRQFSVSASLGALISAGRNVTYTGDNLTSTTPLNIRTTSPSLGGNVTFQSLPGRSLNVSSGGLNVTSRRDILFTSDQNLSVNTSSGSNIRLEADGDIRMLAPGAINVAAAGENRMVADRHLNIQAGANSAISGGNGLSLTAGNLSLDTDLNVTTTAGSLQLTGGTGGTGLFSSRDILIQAATSLTLGSNGVNIAGARDLNLTTGAGSALQINGSTDITSDFINLRTNQINQSTPGQLAMRASQDLNLIPLTSGAFTISAADLFLAADHNLNANVNGGDLNLSATAGSLLVLGANQIDFNVTGGRTRMTAPTGSLSIFGNPTLDGSLLEASAQSASLEVTANTVFAPGSTLVTSGAGGIQATSTQDLDLTHLSLTANAAGPVNLHADRNLKIGTVGITSAANASFTGGNISVHSMQNLSGGNYTINTPGNLTEDVAATNPGPLVGLDITAGGIFNPNNTADNVSFSIPETVNSADLRVLVTGGNDTVLHSSANLRNFGNADVQPGHIQGQTGDIYVDGVLFYQGEAAAPNPPDPPPQPPATPSPPIPSPAAPPPSNAISAEQRTQILAQSNLALGNLGSFSRVLSDTEVERLTARQDSLHQTWGLDPFSPTLALTVPGGPPSVYPRELAELRSLLAMGDDEEEKTRASFNTIVDQELREIWEVRYWRHLLERIILWEDRE